MQAASKVCRFINASSMVSRDELALKPVKLPTTCDSEHKRIEHLLSTTSPNHRITAKMPGYVQFLESS